MTVARNRALDVLRRASVERRKLQELAVLAGPPEAAEPGGEEVVDDRLRLIFTCCHPALALEARVALTLRTVAGVPTADIARAFLVTESTMTRRLTRAKAKIAAGRHPVPGAQPGRALTERLPGVLAVLYLLFTQGYNSDGEPAFAEEAIRLARLLAAADAGPAGDHRPARAVPVPALPAGRPARRRRATCSPWTSRTGRAGTMPRSPRPGRCSTGLPADGPYALQARIAAGHAAARERLAGHRALVRRAGPDPALAGDHAEPGGGARLRLRRRRPG